MTFEELTELVDWVWTMYAPGGLLLSKQEQMEAYEEFEKWRTTGTYWDVDGVRVFETKVTSYSLSPSGATDSPTRKSFDQGLDGDGHRMMPSTSPPSQQEQQQPQSPSQQEQEQEPPSQRRLVPFLEFHAWFIHLTTHIELLRGCLIYSDKTPTTMSKEVG